MIRAETRIIHHTPFRPLRLLRIWSALSRQRRALASLDETRLRDIGLNRDAAETEARRPFWDAPDNWRI